MTAKPEYFDPSLVRIILKVAGPNATLDHFDAAVRQAALDSLGDSAVWFANRWAAWDNAMREKTTAYDRKREEFERAKAAAIRPDPLLEALRRGGALSRDSAPGRLPEPDGIERLRILIDQVNQLAFELDNLNEEAAPHWAVAERCSNRWLCPAPEFQDWSGVREKPFAETLADCFILEGAEAPPMLDFMYQIAFTTPPYFLNGDPPRLDDEAALEELATWTDKEPWEFPAIADKIQQTVRAALEDPKNAEERETLQIVSEFAILQRFFRLGFEGGLGPDFPVELLADLHGSVAPERRPAPARTYRWNSRENALQSMLAVLTKLEIGSLPAEGGGAWVDRIRHQLKTCDALTGEYSDRLTKRGESLGKIEAERPPDGQDETDWQGRWDAAWDEFQDWARQWEDRLESASKELAKLRDEMRSAGERGEAGAAEWIDRVDKFANQFDFGSRALALRRALNVAADDRQFNFEHRSARVVAERERGLEAPETAPILPPSRDAAPAGGSDTRERP